jgi:hypothetical protein
MKQALITGIDNYAAAPLKGCVNDAVAVAELLKHNEDGTKNFDVRAEMNVQNKGLLRKMIRQLFNCEADMALFYFSGHGYLSDVGGYIITPDSKADDYGIPMDEILQMANESDIKNKIIILDCCNAGAFGSPPATGQAAFLRKGMTILTSSREDEPSLIKGNHSVFTGLLLEALKGGAADLKGDVTPGSVYAFIDQAIGNWGQRPLFKANISRFTPLRNVFPPVKKEVLRNIVKYFENEDTIYQLDPTYEHTNEDVAIPANVVMLEELRQMSREGLVVPNGAAYMFDAAQQSKGCNLTNIGKYYWQLVKGGRI